MKKISYTAQVKIEQKVGKATSFYNNFVDAYDGKKRTLMRVFTKPYYQHVKGTVADLKKAIRAIGLDNIKTITGIDFTDDLPMHGNYKGIITFVNCKFDNVNFERMDLNKMQFVSCDLSTANMQNVVPDEIHVKSIDNTGYSIKYWANNLAIGCKLYTIEEWLSFSRSEIASMSPRAIIWWEEHKRSMFNTIKSNPPIHIDKPYEYSFDYIHEDEPLFLQKGQREEGENNSDDDSDISIILDREPDVPNYDDRFFDTRDLHDRYEWLQQFFAFIDAAPEEIDFSDHCFNGDVDSYGEELSFLEELQHNAEDWSHGESVIHEDYWEEYCEEFVKDVGWLPHDLPHFIENNIDWEGVADDISMDYSTINYNNTDYYVR